jgi:uncharacterized protein (DUF697 family)
MTDDQKIKCNAIIHTASLAAGGVGAGLAQIPVADAAVIAPIQLTMVVSLGAVFGISLTKVAAQGIISSFGATFAGRMLVRWLTFWIPGLGNFISASTAAALTQAIGRYAVKQFEAPGANYDRGKRCGFEEASREYEEKLRRQAEEFTQKDKNFRRHKEEYQKLIVDLQKLINEYVVSGKDSALLEADLKKLTSLSSSKLSSSK